MRKKKEGKKDKESRRTKWLAAMVLQRLLPWSTCRTIFGSAEAVLWGEFSGPQGKGGRLTTSPWERMAFVTVFASLRLPVKSQTQYT